MDNKMKGVLFGVAGVILWFTPFVYVQFMGREGYQTGQHIGGIAYLLIFASIAYGALSWLEQYQLALIAGAVATGICALFAIQAGGSIAWGLILLLALSAGSVLLAWRSRQAKPAATTA